MDQSRRIAHPIDEFTGLLAALVPGQWMAYSQHPTDYLWKSRLDGSAAVQLTNLPAFWQHWSPDSKWLAYSDNHKIYRVSADGGPSEQLIATGDHEVGPTWSPDGRSLIFNHWDMVHESDGLSVLDLATHKISPMVGAQGYYVTSWSPDGRYLVAIANNPSRMVLYTAKSKTWSVLKAFDYPWGLYAWSRDSKTIYMAVMQDHKGIFRLSVPDGAWDKIVGLENIDSRPSEAFVSVTADNQPVIMSHTGVEQFYLLRWPH
jgi:dipeptidyl aminopeptidase/acylaminoacyl peptidase